MSTEERLDRIEQKIDHLVEQIDQAANQINGIAEMAGPAIEQLTASPMLRMLTGGGKRGR